MKRVGTAGSLFLKELCTSIGWVSTLTCTSSGVYIANLPGKRLVIVGPSG
jgi:hypothetical protein